MEIIKKKKVEGCLEGQNVWDILFDKQIDKDFIDYLGKMGKLIYKDELKKPFFKVIIRGEFTFKGSESNKSIRVILPDEYSGDWLSMLKEHIEVYSYNKSVA